MVEEEEDWDWEDGVRFLPELRTFGFSFGFGVGFNLSFGFCCGFGGPYPLLPFRVRPRQA